jgi:hypothetical protein
MRHVLFILAILLSQNFLHSVEKDFTMPLTTPTQAAPREVRLQLEISDNDTKVYGIQQANLYTEISTRLALGQIMVKPDTHLPLLLLRVKSIDADRAVATFIQLSFSEDATLTRNKSSILAMTWSQATLISGPKEEVAKEVTQTVITMVNTFILDYQKAMAPA